MTVPHGWRLLPDRLGIEVTAKDPEDWQSGNPKLPGGGAIRGITWWSDPPTGAGAVNGGKPPTLRLTTVIEDDIGLDVTAGKRVASPTSFTRWRAIDAKDHFHFDEVSDGSPFYPS